MLWYFIWNRPPQNVALVKSVNLQAALWPNKEFFLLMFNLHGLRFGVREGVVSMETFSLNAEANCEKVFRSLFIPPIMFNRRTTTTIPIFALIAPPTYPAEGLFTSLYSQTGWISFFFFFCSFDICLSAPSSWPAIFPRRATLSHLSLPHAAATENGNPPNSQSVCSKWC